MKKLYILFLLSCLSLNSAFSAENFYALSAVKINGDTLKFSDLKGKKLLIVNTASLCGYTYQYGELQQLYDLYKNKNFEIIGFPANNFGNQEPGNNEEIDTFCRENYGVTFTMMEKISVLDPGMHPVYQWLTKKSLNGVKDSKVQWNFQKYLINADGTFHQVIPTQTSPLSQSIKDWINAPVSVEATTNNDKLTIYQADNNLFIQTPANLENRTKIGIYNIFGDCVINYELQITNYEKRRIDISAIPSGLYFVRIGNEKPLKFLKM